LNQLRAIIFAFFLGFAASAAGFLLYYEFLPTASALDLSGGTCAFNVMPIFSPASQELFVQTIGSAEKTLEVMLYQFSNPAMQDALANAVKKGVVVRVILEPRVDSNYATAEILSQNGVKVRWASKEYTNTHAKTAVIDGKKVIVGSTNWSKQAMRSNRESSVLIESEGLAREFLGVFEEDWAKASDYAVPGGENAVEN
jgi:phosphatidylserine/phosphatidylglycerophosphate/cardiolipin synthase-like enzyme